MKRIRSARAARLLALAVLSGAAACAGDPESGDAAGTPEPVGVTGEDLFVGHSTWGRDANGVTTTVSVCWQPVANEPADFASLRAVVQRAAQSTWQRASQVTFTGWGSCAAGPAQIALSISDEQPHTGPMLFGSVGIVLNFTFANWSTSCMATKADCVYKIATHEFGHGLGFNHEQARPDTPGWCSVRDGLNDWWAEVLGGTEYGAWDASSVMNYCNPIWNNDGRLSPTDIFGLQGTYGARPAPSACQAASDLYGISANVTWGFAPPDVQAWWGANHCATAPASGDTCQRASDTYGISANVTWGFAPPDVQAWWGANHCATQPLGPTACQRASDLYGIAAGITWGFAPPAVQSWWQANGCATQPVATDPCQKASDLYGIVANVTWGFAPADVKAWWGANGCSAMPGELSVRSVQQ